MRDQFEPQRAERSGDMGKLQEFDITFTNNKVVYGPGESISGTVKIRTGSSLQYKGKKKKKKEKIKQQQQ